MKPNLPGRAYGHGVHLCADRAGLSFGSAPVIDGDAARPALRERLAPARHLGRQVENFQPVVPEAETADALTRRRRIPRDQLATIVVGVPPRGMRQLVDEAFHVEGVQGRAGTATRAPGNME